MADSPRFHIGNQTAFFVPPLRPLDFAVEQGFDAFEFFPDGRPAGPGWTAADLSPETRALIRATAEAHGMRLSVHASLSADLLTAAGRAVLWGDVDLARDIRARVLNIHLAPHGGEGFVGAVLSLTTRLQAAGLVLSIENTLASAPEDFNALFARLQARDAVAARHIGVCLDIGHANLHEDTRNDYLAYFDRLATFVPVVHVHAHENRGDTDSHITLFAGPAHANPAGIEGLVRRLLGRGYAGSVILEQWPDPPGLLSIARRRLQAIIAAAENQPQRAG